MFIYSFRWATVYGNHDTGPLVSRLQILQTEQSYGEELCYTKQLNPDLPGVSNYYIPIYPPAEHKVKTINENGVSEQEEIPVMLWWFLDSRGGYTLSGREPFYIDPAVVHWFGNESRRLQEQWGPLPSLVFVHIPTLVLIPVCSL